LPVAYVLVHERIAHHPLLDRLQAQAIECFAVSEGILKKASGTRYLIPFVGVARLDGEPLATPPGDFVIVLDGVQDHGNVGTIVRTARGFGIRDILATQEDFDLFYKKTIEASRGKVFEVRLRRFGSGQQTVDYLKRNGFQIVATSPYGSALQSTSQLQEKPLALVVGNETDGVSEEILQEADLVVQVPMRRGVESLNVGVATGISVYEFKFKLVMAMLTRYIRTTLGREVNVAGKLIQWALDEALKTTSKFDSTQVILMMVLKCDEVMPLEQVGKDTATFGDELGALLQPLFDEGHIRYVDTARTSIQLTEKGAQLLGQLWGIVEATEDRVLEGFSDSERRQLFDFLGRIQSNCIEMVQ
jgi:TrmH family RNA methyltransferase